MSSHTLLAVLAGCCGVAMALAPLLQLRRMLQQGDASAVSVPFLLVLCLGSLVWLLYGLSDHDPALIVANGCNLLCSASCALVARRLQDRTSVQAGD